MPKPGKYKTVASGPRRTFTITIGLRKGYQPGGVTHHPITAEEIMEEWLRDRVQNDQIAMSGFFTEIWLHYARPESDEQPTQKEPGLRFWGEVSVTRMKKVSDKKIIKALNSLADKLGKALGQEHVIVSYRDLTWVREYQG